MGYQSPPAPLPQAMGTVPTAATVKKPRNSKVETLRILAICGIAIFHTFLPWFNAVAYGANTGVDGTRFAFSGVALFFLGAISLLGSFGNHVFFMISGFFLIPRMENDSTQPGFWARQYRSVGHKIVIILVSVALYATVFLLIDHWWDIPGISLQNVSWLLGGLEFVWVYSALIVVAPIAAFLQQRWSKLWPALLATSFVAIFFVNSIIAFFSQGEITRDLLDWRKIMSALTYLIGFLFAGFVASHWEHFHRVGSSLFLGSLFMMVVVEISLSFIPDAELIGAVSFKSTSIISFLLALGAVVMVMSRAQKASLNDAQSRPARFKRWLAAGTLGFYIIQSMIAPLWSSLLIPWMDNLLVLAPNHGVANSAFMGFLIVGVGVSFGFSLIILIADHLLRLPLLSALNLR